MKCIECRRSIASGIEAQRMICEYVQGDGTTKLFGHQMPEGSISAATGQLLHGWHNACFHAQRKRKARGDVEAGSSYDIAARALTGEITASPGETEERVGALAGDLAARAALRRTVDRRRADPGYTESQVSDWRDQTEVEI